MGILEIIGGVLAVAVFVYLLLALLAPEKLS
jgi:K+-transporting ATPase KdpF subunit